MSILIVSVRSRGNHWQHSFLHYRESTAARRQEGTPVSTKIEAWNAEDESALRSILDFVAAENKRILLQLQEQPGFNELTPRQQAKAYAGVIGDRPLAALFHLARKGELDFASARRIIRNPKNISFAMLSGGL